MRENNDLLRADFSETMEERRENEITPLKCSQKGLIWQSMYSINILTE